MSATGELFKRWKAHKGMESDRSAADALGVSHGTPHHWNQGRNGAASLIEKMARDLGEDPVPVILQAFSEAARDANDKRTLAKLARQLGAACLALLAVVPMMMHSSPAEASSSENAQREEARRIHYAKWLRVAAWRRVKAWCKPFTQREHPEWKSRPHVFGPLSR